MLVIYQTTTMGDSQAYITGWWACPPGDSQAVTLDPQLDGVTQWYDDSGNPLWQLNPDGSASPYAAQNTLQPPGGTQHPVPVVTAIAVQLAVSRQTTILNSCIFDIINCLVNGQPADSVTLSTWNTAYAAWQVALIAQDSFLGDST
jgi:hypothetical protein